MWCHIKNISAISLGFLLLLGSPLVFASTDIYFKFQSDTAGAAKSLTLKELSSSCMHKTGPSTVTPSDTSINIETSNAFFSGCTDSTSDEVWSLDDKGKSIGGLHFFENASGTVIVGVISLNGSLSDFIQVRCYSSSSFTGLLDGHSCIDPGGAGTSVPDTRSFVFDVHM